MEADYLKRTVGGYLAEGLAEVSVKRPSDPIEYLALWLLKQKQNIINQQVSLNLYIHYYIHINNYYDVHVVIVWRPSWHVYK